MNHQHIDVGVALRRSVCHLYSDLVTRPTGAAVRREIEQQLALAGDRTLTVIDFSQVGLLDFSCADEVVAKLLLRYCAGVADAPPHEGYFLFRGVREVHFDAIEAVLERHGLALVVESEPGAVHLMGVVEPGEREVWSRLERAGRRSVAQLAAELQRDAAAVEPLLQGLCRRRLAVPLDDGYVAVGPSLLTGRLQ
ncbi:MAG TPA: hypothetical protein VFS08_08935 [Gemmatimonadaceae bacterium]|nr:hypothetical protein [Gemmatimonadaceae bacterium]